MPEELSPATQPEQTAAPKPELRFEFSPSIGKLIEALAKASVEFTPIVKDSENPFFKSKYADLAAVIDATRPFLGKNGLAVLQPSHYSREAGMVEIITLLAHSSGEWLRCKLEMPMAKQDAQGIGSAITYGRRYSYSAVLNVASEQDDDGNAAVSKDFKRKEETEQEFDQRTESQQCIAVFQIQAIDQAIKRTGKTEAEVLAYLNLIGHKRIEHILKSEFQDFLKWANSTSVKSEAKVKPASALPKPKDEPRTKAMKRLWATAAEHSIPESDVKTCSYEKFKVQSMTELTEGQLEEMTDWVKAVARAVSES